jgi:hypothetical protein
MKKITIMAIPIVLLAACQKESMPENANKTDTLSPVNSKKPNEKDNEKDKDENKEKETRPIFVNLQSDPDPNPTSPYGGALA